MVGAGGVARLEGLDAKSDPGREAGQFGFEAMLCPDESTLRRFALSPQDPDVPVQFGQRPFQRCFGGAGCRPAGTPQANFFILVPFDSKCIFKLKLAI